MYVVTKLTRFARKPLPDKWTAITATTGSAVGGLRRRLAKANTLKNRIRRSFAHARAENLEFNSGLGDSAELLYALTRSIKPTTCVEIGSACGKSACYIGMALKENGFGRLFAIDPHSPTGWNDPGPVDSLEAFRANVAALGVDEQIMIVRSTSQQAAQGWDRQIDLLFIDGDHTYEGVKRDWELFNPHVRPFGIVVFHDTAWELPPFCDRDYARADMGVPRFVDELRRQGYPVLTINKDFGFTLVQTVRGGCPLWQPPEGAQTTDGDLRTPSAPQSREEVRSAKAAGFYRV